MGRKICQNLQQRRKVKLYMCSDTLSIVGKYVLHCNDIDPFVMLMGNFIGDPFHIMTSFLQLHQLI